MSVINSSVCSSVNLSSVSRTICKNKNAVTKPYLIYTNIFNGKNLIYCINNSSRKCGSWRTTSLISKMENKGKLQQRTSKFLKSSSFLEYTEKIEILKSIQFGGFLMKILYFFKISLRKN